MEFESVAAELLALPLDQFTPRRNARSKEIKAAEGAAPADPAGDGKATCPPVSIAMAGALNGPDAALGINIKNGGHHMS